MKEVKVVITESLCGWCETNYHGFCSGVTQRFYMGVSGKDKGRIIYIPNEYNSCNCPPKHDRFDVRKVREIEDVDVNPEVL